MRKSSQKSIKLQKIKRFTKIWAVLIFRKIEHYLRMLCDVTNKKNIATDDDEIVVIRVIRPKRKSESFIGFYAVNWFICTFFPKSGLGKAVSNFILCHNIYINVEFFSAKSTATGIEKYLNEDPPGFQKKWMGEDKGFGLVATKMFHKGDFLLFYRGERITEEIANQRLQVGVCIHALKLRNS